MGSERGRELKDVSGRGKEYGARIETDYQRVSKIVGNARTLTLSLSNGVIIPPHPRHPPLRGRFRKRRLTHSLVSYP